MTLSSTWRETHVKDYALLHIKDSWVAHSGFIHKQNATQRHTHHRGTVQIKTAKAKLSSWVVRFSPYAAAPVEYLLLKREPIYFPRRTGRLWPLAVEHQKLHAAVPDPHTHKHKGWGRGWCSNPKSFDRLSGLTYSCYILMCNDPWRSLYSLLSLTYRLFWHQWRCQENKQAKLLCSNILLCQFLERLFPLLLS